MTRLSIWSLGLTALAVVTLAGLDPLVTAASAQRARALCRTHGPLTIVSQPLWQKISTLADQADLNGDRRLDGSESAPLTIAYRIELRAEERQGSLLLSALRYTSLVLFSNGQMVAELNYYRSDEAGPLQKLLFGETGTRFSCVDEVRQPYLDLGARPFRLGIWSDGKPI